MTKDKCKTAVIFRKIKFKKVDGFCYGEIIAIFPYVVEGIRLSLQDTMCYSFSCQHGSCDYDYIIYISEPATEEEYRGLKDHMENDVGYNIKAIKQRNRASLSLSRTFRSNHVGSRFTHDKDTHKIFIGYNEYSYSVAVFPYTIGNSSVMGDVSLLVYHHKVRQIHDHVYSRQLLNLQPCSYKDKKKVMNILEMCCPYELIPIKEIDTDKVNMLIALEEIKR